MNKRRLAWIVGSLMIASAAIMVACSSDDSSGTNPPKDGGQDATGNDASSLGSITGTVTYSGTQTPGPTAYVALVPDLTGTKPPLKIAVLSPVSFPWTFNMTNIGAGNYYIFAYLSIGADHPTGPRPGDPTSMPTPVSVTNGQTANVTLQLQDPVTDGGTSDASDASDADAH